MNTKNLLTLALLGLALACSPPPPAAEAPAAPAVQVAYDEGSIQPGDMALCVVCVANGGPADAEEVAETIAYQGKTYAFCNESEKAEFISNPARYASR